MNVVEVSQSYKSSIIFSRWAANLIDNIFVYFNFLILPYFLQERYGEKIIGTGTFFIIFLLSLVFIFLYFTLMEGLTGYTIGKLIFRLRVVKADGTLPGLWKAAQRAALRAFEVYLIGLVGFLVAITSKEKQRLGDMLAKTYVLKSKDIIIEKKAMPWWKYIACGLLIPVILGVISLNVINIGYSATHPGVIAKKKANVIISKDKLTQLTLMEGWSEDAIFLNKIDAQIKAIHFNESIFLITHTYPKAELLPETRLENINTFINSDFLKKTSPKNRIEINGCPAIQFTSTKWHDFDKFNYLFTLIETPGYFHLVICWVEDSPFDDNLEEMKAVVRGFSEVKK